MTSTNTNIDRDRCPTPWHDNPDDTCILPAGHDGSCAWCQCGECENCISLDARTSDQFGPPTNDKPIPAPFNDAGEWHSDPLDKSDPWCRALTVDNLANTGWELNAYQFADGTIRHYVLVRDNPGGLPHDPGVVLENYDRPDITGAVEYVYDVINELTQVATVLDRISAAQAVVADAQTQAARFIAEAVA